MSDLISGGNQRNFVRGGGGEPIEWVILNTAPGNTCLSFCLDMMKEAPVCGGGYCAALYAKCYDAISPTPLNGIRVAFPSQIGTSGIDPLLPLSLDYRNITRCLRKQSEILLFLNISIDFLHKSGASTAI